MTMTNAAEAGRVDYLAPEVEEPPKRRCLCRFSQSGIWASKCSFHQRLYDAQERKLAEALQERDEARRELAQAANGQSNCCKAANGSIDRLRSSLAAAKEEARVVREELSRIHGFLESTCPPGFADEAFRPAPDRSLAASREGQGGGEVSDKTILDPCCGSRMWWFDRQHPDVIYGDRRSETLTVTDRSNGNLSGQRIIHVSPDQVMDFRALPFPDGAFKLVAFDPPHLVRAGPKSWLAAKYGKLSEDWRDDLRRGLAECFRVLEPHGVLIFKWSETQVKIAEILALTPNRPLFGSTSGKKSGTHWMCFMKGASHDAG